ncbi:hypothetical protein L6452_26243 [Arctium lappa]|uniref:Uncharacterized protein n=1 Tax=Arctium lappa TaxID=4217 RepID=A0ACB9AC92_ARCLA|nr:hypothetical protein L6452_26243 [Arctium lappa]
MSTSREVTWCDHGGEDRMVSTVVTINGDAYKYEAEEEIMVVVLRRKDLLSDPLSLQTKRGSSTLFFRPMRVAAAANIFSCK